VRLANIGVGELADRLSILALKIAHATQAGKDASHFVNERNVLVVQFRSHEPAAEHLFDLAAVNAMLWHAEDDLREYRQAVPEPDALGDAGLVAVARVAYRIQALNDRRAELVGTLNKLAGTDLGPEKL